MTRLFEKRISEKICIYIYVYIIYIYISLDKFDMWNSYVRLHFHPIEFCPFIDV